MYMSHTILLLLRGKLNKSTPLKKKKKSPLVKFAIDNMSLLHYTLKTLDTCMHTLTKVTFQSQHSPKSFQGGYWINQGGNILASEIFIPPINFEWQRVLLAMAQWHSGFSAFHMSS